MTEPLTDPDEIGRRIRAAIVLAGLNGVPELARELNTPGLGQDTLYAVLNNKRPVGRHELREIAEVCGLPFEFFSIDFGRLPELTGEGRDERLAEIKANQETLAAAIDTISAQVEATSEQSATRHAEVLRALDRRSRRAS